jgi:hypothetical protein
MLHDCFLMTESKKPLTILLASPRSFCTDVDRAIFVDELDEVPDDRLVVFKLRRQLVA